MKFTNAYDLILFLFKNDLISGLYLGLRGEYEIKSRIKDIKLLKLLDEIWGDWRWGETDGKANAIHEGFYNFSIDSKDVLVMELSVQDDILDYHGNPFEIEKILEIISDNIELDFIDEEECLEYQICIDIELKYENINNSIYDLSVFSIKSFESDDDKIKELTTKLDERTIKILKEKVVEYLLSIHKKNHNYDGFSLIINENYFSNYTGTDLEEVKDIKSFLENYTLEFNLDLDKLVIIP